MTSGILQVRSSDCVLFAPFGLTLLSLQDSLPSAGGPSASSPRFRPYASPSHHVIKSRYITSNDPRGYMSVVEDVNLHFSNYALALSTNTR